MFRPISLFIGLRYLRAKKRNHFISIIAAISFIGIALGVAVLITVMSVMNGFDSQIKKRVLMMVPPVKVYKLNGAIDHWPKLADSIQSQTSQVTGAAPLVEGQGILSNQGQNAFVMAQGIDPKQESKVVPIDQHMARGDLKNLKKGQFNIVLGKTLAKNLGVGVGDKVTMVVPKASVSPAGVTPRLKRFTVAGIFSVSYQYDAHYALMNIDDAQVLYQQSGPTALQLGMNDIYQAPRLKQLLNQSILPGNYIAQDWSDDNKSFFDALNMEKTMMFFILLLIIAVAIFNLLSSLVMVVTDKRSDIAILRTMGASSKQIIAIFVVQGLAIGVIGILIGLGLGVLLSVNATAIVEWIQHAFGVQFLNASVYQIDYVPSKLVWSDVWHVSAAALLLSFLATLYPAWSASRVQPVEALRYE